MDKDKLYDHYTDTFSQQKEYIAKRDRLTICLLLSLVAFAMLMANPAALTKVVDAYAKKELSFEGNLIDFSILNTGLIYILLWFVLQYFQVCLTIEKQYDYLWDLEEELSKKGYEVTCEGRGYASDYPLLKNAANILYAWGIPIGIGILSIVRIVYECRSGIGIWPDYVGLGLILVLSALYFSDRNLRWDYLCPKKHSKLSFWKRMMGFIKIDVEETDK